MAKYRSYKEAMQAVQDIEFTSQGRFKSKSDFASKARYWSESTFKKRLGQARRNFERRENRRKLIEKGFTRKQADRLKGRKKEFLKDLLKNVDGKGKGSGVTIRDPKHRKRLWQEWAKAQNFPDWIEEKAKRINEEEGKRLQEDLGIENAKGFDINDSFGYAVMFYSFMRDEPIEMILEDMKVDPHDGNIYMYARAMQNQG